MALALFGATPAVQRRPRLGARLHRVSSSIESIEARRGGVGGGSPDRRLRSRAAANDKQVVEAWNRMAAGRCEPGDGAGAARGAARPRCPGGLALRPGADDDHRPARRPARADRGGPLHGGEDPGARLVELEGGDHIFFAGDTRPDSRRGRGAGHRVARRRQPRSHSRDCPVHRHRRLDRAGRARWATALARPALPARRGGPPSDRPLPRPRGEVDRRRDPGDVRRPGARRSSAPARSTERSSRSASRSGPACTRASAR